MEQNRPFIDWPGLANPILGYEHWSVKDVCVYYEEEQRLFYLYFSAFALELFRTHIIGVTTRDFVHYSEPFMDWDGLEQGVGGLCSPSILQAEGRYVLSFNAWGDVPGQPNQLYYTESQDLMHWSGVRRLAPQLTEGVRSIDAVLAYSEGRYYLTWKERQVGNPVAVASALDGNDWRLIGKAQLDGIYENAQLLCIDGAWRMLATHCSVPHETYLFTMDGDGASPEHWLRWTDKRRLRVPLEGFNTKDHSNAGFMADWRQYDGYFYLLYAGNTELEQYRGRGHCRIGLARSADLSVWEKP